MADPKSRIMEHLARSTGNFNFENVAQPTRPQAESMPSERRQRMLEHVARSKGTFGTAAGTSDRKRQILNHVQQTMNS
jgi:hypothetical protein